MPLPAGTLTADLVTQTHWGYRRNRFYFEPSSAPGNLPALEACADAIFDAIAPLVTPLMASHATVRRIEAAYWGAGDTHLEANSTVPALDGEIASATVDTEGDESAVADMLPDEASLIVQVRTGLAGRSKNGRRFFTGLSEQIQNSGVLIPEFKPTAKALADALSDDIVVEGEDAPTLHARHYDRLGNTLRPVLKCYAVVTIGTRRDRRRPLRLERV